MRWLGRLLRLLVGLLYRLVVLLLFEKWVPFPERAGPEQVAPPAPRSARKKKRARDQGRRMGAPRGAGASEPDVRARPAIFSAQSSELSPEEAARREGEHWLTPRSPRPVSPARAPRESLAGLLRDRGALRDAVMLGAALAARRPKL